MRQFALELLAACIWLLPRSMCAQDSVSVEARLLETIEHSCWPGDAWWDPGVLLWLIDHPADSTARGRSIRASGVRDLGGFMLRTGGGVHARPDRQPSDQPRYGRHFATVRATRTWKTPGPPNTSSVTLTLNPGSTVSAEGRWTSSALTGRRSLAGALEVRDLGIFSAVVAGDYLFAAGEGLIFGRGSTFAGIVSRPILADQIGIGIPGLPGGTTGVLVRCAGEMRIGEPSVTICYSQTRRDRARVVDPAVDVVATTEDDTDGSPVVVGGSEQVCGARLAWRFPSGISCGCSGMQSILREGRPDAIRTAGIDLKAGGEASACSFEIARQSGGITALAASVDLRLGRALRVCGGGRSLGRGYWNPHATDVYEDGDARSERRVWGACVVDPVPWLAIDASTEWSRKYSYLPLTPLLLSSTKTSVRLDLEASQMLRAVMAVALSSRERTSSGLDPEGRTVTMVREWQTWTARMDFAMHLHRHLESSVKMAGSWCANPVSGTTERGFLVAFGCRWAPSRMMLLEGRWTVYSTDSYESRLYLVEQVVQGKVRFVMLTGEGERCSLRMQIGSAAAVRISFAASVASRSGVPPGQCRVPGELAAQIDVRL